MGKSGLVIAVLVLAVIGGVLVFWATPKVEETPVIDTSKEGLEPVDPSGKTILVGTVDTDPTEKIRKFKPLTDYLNQVMKDRGLRFKATAATNMTDLRHRFKDGKFHVYIDSAFPVYDVARDVDLKVILRRWKKGVKEYHTVVFIKSASEIKKPEELVGKKICFEDPWSSSAHLLPRGTLIEKGVSFVALKSANEAVPKGKCGYLFSNDEETTVVWVNSGRVEAGAIDNKGYQDIPEEQRQKFRVILETRKLPRHLVAFHASMDEKIRQQIVDALLAMEETENGKAALESFSKTSRFDKLEEEAELRESVQKMLELIEKER